MVLGLFTYGKNGPYNNFGKVTKPAPQLSACFIFGPCVTNNQTDPFYYYPTIPSPPLFLPNPNLTQANPTLLSPPYHSMAQTPSPWPNLITNPPRLLIKRGSNGQTPPFPPLLFTHHHHCFKPETMVVSATSPLPLQLPTYSSTSQP